MGMVQLLFGFEGRINRAQYWTVGIAVGFLAALIVVALALNTGLSWGATQDEMVRALMGFLLALVPVFGVIMWISTALQVKRFHDRGQSGFWVLLPWGVTALIGIGMIFLLPVSWLIGLAFLVNLGFLPGQEGANRFGGASGTPGAGGAPSAGPRTAKQTATTMLGAEAAMERALAEQKLRAAAPAALRAVPAAAARAPASPAGGAPSFGRRVTR